MIAVRESAPLLFRRWMRFNAVGLIGMVLQLLVLTSLVKIFQVGYLAATLFAVETAVLHNFAWHERFTWSDRPCRRPGARLRRLLKFNLSNGAVSLAGNLLLMRLLVGSLHVPVLESNLVAISVCSLVNFGLGDRVIFQPVPDPKRPKPLLRRGDSTCEC